MTGGTVIHDAGDREIAPTGWRAMRDGTVHGAGDQEIAPTGWRATRAAPKTRRAGGDSGIAPGAVWHDSKYSGIAPATAHTAVASEVDLLLRPGGQAVVGRHQKSIFCSSQAVRPLSVGIRSRSSAPARRSGRCRSASEVDPLLRPGGQPCRRSASEVDPLLRPGGQPCRRSASEVDLLLQPGGLPVAGRHQKSIFCSSQAVSSSTGTSSCCMVSRSRTVTLPVSAVSKSTQMQ